MKQSICACLILIVCLESGYAQSSKNDDRQVKVLSFNILHGATTQGDFDLDVIANVIKTTDPDLVALQEVDFKTNRARGMDLVIELGWRTKMASLFGRGMPFDGGEYGEGILSKFSLIESRNVALPYSPGNEPRAALEIITTLPSGDTIAFVGTHLEHQFETDRISQVRKINEVFSQNEFPTILAGDLNAVPGSKPIDLLEAIWTPTYDKKDPDPTYSSSDPKIKIDYVMYYPEERWRIIDTKVIQDSIASDHYAYLVTLELLAAE